MADPDPGQDAPKDRPDAPNDSDAAEHQVEGLDLARSIARAYTNGPNRRKTPKRRTRPVRSQPAATGSHPDDRDPQSLESAMARLVAEHGWKTDVAVHSMFGRWAEIVGEEIAQHCTPQGYADGELRVAADSTAWATQLRLLAPTVVAKMNEQLGDGTVLRITVLGPQAPSWKKGRRSVRGRGPRDTYG